MMRLLGLALITVAAHAASVNTSATATIIYNYCSDRASPASCVPGGGTQNFTGGATLDLFFTFPPIIGGESVTAAARYGGGYVQVNSNTGIMNGPPGNVSSTVQTAVIEAGASFSDVIHFLDGPGIAFIDVTASCSSCFRVGAGQAGASFRVGTAQASMTTGFPEAFTQHLITQFALDGTLTLSGGVSVRATEEVPADPNIGSSFATAEAGLRSFIVTDAAGNVIHPSYYTDSGTAYLGQVGFVPEPGTWLLALAGLLSCISRLIQKGPNRRDAGTGGGLPM